MGPLKRRPPQPYERGESRHQTHSPHRTSRRPIRSMTFDACRSKKKKKLKTELIKELYQSHLIPLTAFIFMMTLKHLPTLCRRSLPTQCDVVSRICIFFLSMPKLLKANSWSTTYMMASMMVFDERNRFILGYAGCRGPSGQSAFANFRTVLPSSPTIRSNHDIKCVRSSLWRQN